MKRKLFFLPSKTIAERITETFDFVWPTAAAIWNLRWQVQGLIGALPAISEAELLGRFVLGSGIRGANLRRSCLEVTWEAQQEQFAKFLLFEFCALYETWCEIMSNLLTNDQKERRRYSDALQFPPGKDKNNQPSGVVVVRSKIATNPSSILSQAIQITLSTNGKNSPAHLSELLDCYRYFKELRNCLIHGSGVALGKLANAESIYAAHSAAALGLSQRPEHIPCPSGQHPRVSLRGVVGFGEVVLKLITTLDIEMAGSTYAENDFKKRWRDVHGSTPYSVSASPKSRAYRIRLLVQKLGLPSPSVTPAFDAWLKSERLTFY